MRRKGNGSISSMQHKGNDICLIKLMWRKTGNVIFKKCVKILSMAPDVHERESDSFIPPPITGQHKNRISPFWISRVLIQRLSKYIVKRKAKLVLKLYFLKNLKLFINNELAIYASIQQFQGQLFILLRPQGKPSMRLQ